MIVLRQRDAHFRLNALTNSDLHPQNGSFFTLNSLLLLYQNRRENSAHAAEIRV